MTVEHSQSSEARRIQQREIAERAGVSVSTVSRVLNNVAGISQTVQQRVLAAAGELGYAKDQSRPRRRVQGAPRDEQHTVRPDHHIPTVTLLTKLLLQPSIDPFHTDVLHGVQLACSREGAHLNYSSFGHQAANSEAMIEWLRQNPVEGLLLLSSDDPALIEPIQAMRIPIVMINVDRYELPIDTFLPDNHQGAMLATQHLIAHGHRRILHITWSRRRTIQRRTAAYQAALAEAGIPYDPRLVIDTHISAEDTYQEMRRRLAQRDLDFSAVFCANDLAAMGFMRAAQEAGLRVPQDVSVVGFDDIATAGFLSPPLTTVRIETAELARLALRRLLERAASPDLTPVRVLLSCRLIERQSVARAQPPT